MAKKQKSKFPFGLTDRTGTIPNACPIVAVAESFEAVRIVYKNLWPEVRVCDGVVLRMHMAPDRETSIKDSTIYYVPPASETPLDTWLDNLRRCALENGATPEAVRLLGELSPWNKKEEAIMAEKLKAKGSAAKPDKEGLKSAAKKTPVAKGKPRGNPEALAKARAARQSTPDTRKITPKIKAKDITARAGTFRHQMITDALNSKTVDEWKSKGDGKYDAGCLRYLTEQGIISVPAK